MTCYNPAKKPKTAKEKAVGYTPGDKAWKSGAIYCKQHPSEKSHVQKDEHFPPTHQPGCEWEYSQ
jgi:hypothetical protein